MVTASVLGSTEAILALSGGAASAIAAVVAQRLARERSRLDAERRKLDKGLVNAQETATRLRRALNEHGTVSPGVGGPPGPPSPPKELVTAMASRDCVLFIGSELGHSLGLTSWSETLARVIDTLEGEYPEGDWETLQEQLVAGETELVADVLRSRVSEDYLREIIVDVSDTENEHVAPVFRSLAELSFAGVVTDIWSEAIPHLFRSRRPVIVRPGDRQDLTMLLHNERFFVTRVHGSPRDESSLILSWEDYRNAVTEDLAFGRFVSSLANSRVLLFVGASESDIELFMLGSHIRGSTREHYALVPWHGNIDLQSERLHSRFGVQLLPYSTSEGHEALDAFAAALASRVQTSPQRVLHSAVPALTELHLENIGPFEDLQLPLDEATNVLLGDNASGKSTILRALALGLAGDSVDMGPAAEELLRVGASTGSISIVAGREHFRTVLRRNRRTVRVITENISPVAAGSMLALGFPPLRGLSQTAARSPSYEGPRRPGPEDLLPLAANEVDRRLEGVVQWIVNTASRAGVAGPESRRRHERTLATFFDVVSDLTPALRLVYSGVDRDNQRQVVLIDTDDGIMPITYVSRGMIAVLSWVGVLLQRLAEAYPRRPEEVRLRPGLLLLDEIDLHLHPEWQREILPRMRDRFPNLQVVVSTHSPLVVGSLQDGQLVRLTRSADGIAHEIFFDDFDAWRSDQILTGPAFGLATTRDRHTEELMREYERLIMERTLGEAQQARVDELARLLRGRVPMPQETALGRQAAELVGDALEQRLRSFPPGEREALAAEAERYLARLSTGELS